MIQIETTDAAPAEKSVESERASAFVSIQYGHWGITISQRHNERDYAPFVTEFFGYRVGTRGPIDDAIAEAAAIDRLKQLGGIPKGPFFSTRA